MPLQGEQPAEAGPEPRDPGDSDAVRAELFAAARKGDRSATARLLRPETDRVYAVCLRMVGRPEVARDLAQDTLVKVIRGLPAFDGRSKLSTWVTRVALNTCLTWLRDSSKRAELQQRAAVAGTIGVETREHQPGSGVESEERRAGVLRALERVSAEHRAVLVLRDVRGLEYEQIAAVLKITVGTVKSRLFRARAALRRQIEDAGGGAGAAEG